MFNEQLDEDDHKDEALLGNTDVIQKVEREVMLNVEDEDHMDIDIDAQLLEQKKEEGKSVISTNSDTSTPASLTCVALGSCDVSRHTAIITCGADADFSILLRHRSVVKVPLLRRDDTSATNLLSRCRDVYPHSILRRTTWALLLRCKC